MAANPLLLTIIVLMHWRGVRLPSQRVQVYEIATDTLIEHWTAQRGVAELDAQEVKGILAPIAHYILSSNVAGVIAHHDLLPRFYEGIAAQRGCDKAEAKQIGRQMLKNLNEQSGLFLERGLDVTGQPVYGFLHQTFGEYLAALCLAEEMQGGRFSLEEYIHHSMWHEPLLLMAGHLSIYSKPQANALLRNILDFPAPYEKVLQRNVLLAADCLADDIQVQPHLRDEVLDKLARLLEHDAPQVREAALERYRHLVVTRHHEAAVAALKRAYGLDGCKDLGVPAETRLSLATALIHLREVEVTQPILWPLDSMEYRMIGQAKVRRLRFEGWPEQAADYLLQLQADKDYHFSVSAGPDLASSTLGPVDAGLARRVLGEAELLGLIGKLMDRVKGEASKAALRWMAILASETPSSEALISLMAADTPAHVRRLAATRLLQSDQRATAIAVLQDLAEKEPDEAPAAAQALLEAGEATCLDLGLLRDTALMANNDNAHGAIGTLLQIGDRAIAVPAAFHLIATCQPENFWERDQRIWSAVEGLIANGCTEVGLAAARWLALRPGYRYRMEACEALLEAGRVEQTIPLLQYLAYECHDETSQRACGRLLVLKEVERVVPLLALVAHKADPNLRYQACMALALTNYVSPDDVSPPLRRSELKTAILSDRTVSYQAALYAFCRTGLEVLDTLGATDDPTRSAQDLGRFSLKWLAGSLATPDQRNELDALMGSAWPAVSVNAAKFGLRAGQVDRARRRLMALLAEGGQTLSLPVRLEAVKTLGRIAGPETTGLLIQALKDRASNVRWSAASALGTLGDPAAVPPLIAALSDEESDVRRFAAYALGALGDPAAMPPLIAALSDEGSNVRRSAADALGVLGDPAAVPPLIAALSDEESYVCSFAASALGMLGAIEATLILAATSSAEDSEEAQRYAEALVHLDPAGALPVLERYARQFRRQGWTDRLRGQALWRLGKMDAARTSLKQAVEREDSSDNLLALAHFYLEQAELQTAQAYVERALEKAPRKAICLLSRAVLLWKMGQITQALETLVQAQRRDRRIARVKDLQYEHFWGPKALAALEAMLAQAAATEA